MAKQPFYPTGWCRVDLLLDDFGQSGADNLVSFQNPPIDFEVVKNAYTKADTFRVKVDFEDFPFDPRLLRGGTVQLFLGSADGPADVGYWSRQDTAASRAQCLMAGVVDYFEPTLDENGRVFEMKGRDYTAYFLDAELAPGDLIWSGGSGKLSIVAILESLIAQRPTTSKALTVEDRTPGGLAAKLYPADYKQRALSDPKLSARKKRHGETIWDFIQELALEAGLVVYVELDRLVVAEPATIFKGQGDPARLIHYTLGGEVTSYKPSRKLGRQHKIAVRVASVDTDNGKVRVAFSPKDAETKAQAIHVAGSEVGASSPKAATQEKPPIRPFVVRGITSKAQLQRIADQILEQLRHHEMHAQFETHEIVDSQGLACQGFHYGDPLVFDLAESLRSILVKPVDEQIRTLLAIGYEKATAQQIASLSEDLRVPFYVHSLKYRAAWRSGASFTLEGEVRSRKQVET